MNDDTSARLIEIALELLRTDVLGAVSDPVARIKLDHATRLLWAASARLGKREAALGELTRALGGDAISGDAEAARRKAEAQLAERLPALLADAATNEGARTELRRTVDALRHFYVELDPEVAGGAQVVYRGGRIEKERPVPVTREFAPINPATLTAYLRRRFGKDGFAASEVRHIPGGFSKETVFFTLTDADAGTSERLVIRKDLSIPLNNATVVDEFPLLERLHAAGFPVAKPRWLETDTSLFGGAMLVSDRVAGTSDAAAWTADPARAAKACAELAQIMAQIHAFSPEAAGYSGADAALSAGQWLEREIARWTGLFKSVRQEAFPMQEMPLVWLANNIPPDMFERPARLLHGDIGFHNLMFDEEGRATAVLDWEFSTLGDPTQDLRFVRQFIEPIGLWDSFLADYRAAGGQDYLEEAGFFFDLFTIVRNAVGCVHCQLLFDTAMPREGRFALAGHVFAPYMFVEQCEALLAHIDAQAAERG